MFLRNDPSSHQALLFMISKETFMFGPVLKEHFQCDFILIKLEVPYEQLQTNSFGFISKSEHEMTEAKLEAIAYTRKANIQGLEQLENSPMITKQIEVLKDEKTGLEHDNTNLKEEVKQFSFEIETANKSIMDKERNIK